MSDDWEQWPDENPDYQEEAWPDNQAVPEDQQGSWPDPNAASEGYDFNQMQQDQAPVAATEISSRPVGKNSIMPKVIAIGVVVLIVAVIVGVVLLLAYNPGLKQDDIKRQFPAAMNVQLAMLAGAEDQEITNSPYFYFDTEMKEDKGFFKTPLIQGADNGAVIFVKDSDYIEDQRGSNVNYTLTQICTDMANDMSLNMKAESDAIDSMSGGKVETHSDSESTWKEDYRYRIDTELEVDPVETNEDGSVSLFASWYLWSDGTGGGWRMVQAHILADFIPVEGSPDPGDESIVVLIAHGANPKDADQAYADAESSTVYQNVVSGSSPGTRVVSQFSEYNTFSGTMVSTDSQAPTKKVGGGSIGRWLKKDTEDTNHESRDPGTYGYFISYKHQDKYTPKGYVIGGHSTRTISGGAK